MTYEITKIACPIRMTYDPGMEPVSEGLYYWDWCSEEFGERWLLIETASQKRHMFWSDMAIYRGEPINEFGTQQLTEHIVKRYGPFSTPVHGRVTFLTKNYPRHCYRIFEESAEDVIEWCSANIQTPHIVRHCASFYSRPSETDVIFERLPKEKERLHFKLRWG